MTVPHEMNIMVIPVQLDQFPVYSNAYMKLLGFLGMECRWIVVCTQYTIEPSNGPIKASVVLVVVPNAQPNDSATQPGISDRYREVYIVYMGEEVWDEVVQSIWG